ncbi:hypothetical protein C8R44DRAFT_869562 [Mycena epipterygia]|nr:hypothetical protein C8R44DRAFT_869562 [Mycena epipterygia]
MSVPDLVARMPAIRELSILFSADLTGMDDELYPPFTLGIPRGENIAHHCPLLNKVTLFQHRARGSDFSATSRILRILGDLLAVRDHYMFRERPRPPREAAFTAIDVPVVLASISGLDVLAELTLSLEGFPADLGRYYYPHADVYEVDVRDDAIIEALRELPNITHLRLTLDFFERDYQEEQQGSAARWLMAALPGLRVVEWEHVLSWRELDRWQPWDRRVLLRPPTSPRPPPSLVVAPVIMEGIRWH